MPRSQRKIIIYGWTLAAATVLVYSLFYAAVWIDAIYTGTSAISSTKCKWNFRFFFLNYGSIMCFDFVHIHKPQWCGMRFILCTIALHLLNYTFSPPLDCGAHHAFLWNMKLNFFHTFTLRIKYNVQLVASANERKYFVSHLLRSLAAQCKRGRWQIAELHRKHTKIKIKFRGVKYESRHELIKKRMHHDRHIKRIELHSVQFTFFFARLRERILCREKLTQNLYCIAREKNFDVCNFNRIESVKEVRAHGLVHLDVELCAIIYVLRETWQMKCHRLRLRLRQYFNIRSRNSEYSWITLKNRTIYFIFFGYLKIFQCQT